MKKKSVWQKPLTWRTFYSAAWESHVTWWKDYGPLRSRLRASSFAQGRGEFFFFLGQGILSANTGAVLSQLDEGLALSKRRLSSKPVVLTC